MSVQKLSPITTVSKPWKICALYPHLKDSYWISVNFGMVRQAQKLGVNLKILAADGYVDASKQLQQLELCKTWQADAILLGSIRDDLLDSWKGRDSNKTPLFSLINNIASVGVTGKTGVDWYQMGFSTGQALTEKHPKGSPEVTAVWFSSPSGRGGSDASFLGLVSGLKESSVTIVGEFYGDNDLIIKRDLIEQALSKYPTVDYLIGGAVMAEVAIAELRRRGLTGKTKIVSTYLSHGVYRGLVRNKIALANDDQMVHLGRLSIDQAVCYLESKEEDTEFTPNFSTHILHLTPETLHTMDLMYNSLSPAGWHPVYDVIQTKAPQKTQSEN